MSGQAFNAKCEVSEEKKLVDLRKWSRQSGEMLERSGPDLTGISDTPDGRPRDTWEDSCQ